MLTPLIWLKDFVNIKANPETVAEKLLLSGTKVEEIKKVNGEVIFDLEITPNRPDTLSIIGVAREISALLGQDLKQVESDFFTHLNVPKGKISLKIKDKKLCPYYSVVLLNNIKVGPSSGWLAKYLTLVGIRPINNVVDVTNFVMIELGQPMHAFDASKIKGSLILRASKEGETITTLDSIDRPLPTGSIVIEDQEKIIDLCGLMGGKVSEIDNKTERIILLVPVYDPTAIRKTSLQTNLRTEASNRFEKKLDPNMHPTATNRAISLLIEEAGATVDSSINTVGYPVEARKLEFSSQKVKNILGIELTTSEIIDLLSPLGFQVSQSSLDEDKLNISIPSFRNDVALEEDILEEIGRQFGYNNFPKTLPRGAVPVQKENFQPDNQGFIRERLMASGFTETTGYTLVSEADLKKCLINPSGVNRVLHPTSTDFVFLRPTLLINSLNAIATNLGRDNSAFFEIAKEFSEQIKAETLPKQNRAIVASTTQDYLVLKGTYDYILNKYNLDTDISIINKDAFFESGVEYRINEKIIGRLGVVKKEICKNFGIESPVSSLWLDFEFLETKSRVTKYKPKPKYPSVIEDISFLTTSQTLASEVLQFIPTISDSIQKVEIFDVFEKDDQKSISVRLNYYDRTKTLAGKDVEKIRVRVIKALEKKFSAKIR